MRRIKTRHRTACSCRRLRIEVVVYRRYVVRTVFPGNPREEWLWFKFLLRKGMFIYIRPSHVTLFRQVNCVTCFVLELCFYRAKKLDVIFDFGDFLG